MKTSSFFHVLHFKPVIKKEQFKGKGHENSYGRGQLLPRLAFQKDFLFLGFEKNLGLKKTYSPTF